MRQQRSAASFGERVVVEILLSRSASARLGSLNRRTVGVLQLVLGLQTHVFSGTLNNSGVVQEC